MRTDPGDRELVLASELGGASVWLTAASSGIDGSGLAWICADGGGGGRGREVDADDAMPGTMERRGWAIARKDAAATDSLSPPAF